jgi:Glycosyltransferase
VAKVLLTVHKFFPDHRAGTEILTLKIAQTLKQRGHEVLIVTANPPDTDARYKDGEELKRYVWDGINVISVEESLRLKGNKFSHEYFNPNIGAFFSEILKSFQPDVVHVMHAQNLSASIIEVAKEAGVRVVLSPTDFWFICPIVQLKRPDGQVCEGPGPKGINCLTCYTPHLVPPPSEFAEAFSKRFPRLNRTIAGGAYPAYVASKLPSAINATSVRPEFLRNTANKCDAISVPTLLMKRLFIKNGITPDLIHHIPFGIDTAPLLAFQNKTASEVLRIGFIGTIFEHKGVDLLVSAFQRLKQPDKAVLTIYGNPDQFPEYFKKVQELVDSHPLTREKIAFPGTFPNERFGEILQKLDVLVVPSRWYENTPLVMQSALATRTPLIATDLGGMSELIEPEKNGLLFALNDVAGLAAQLDKLIEQPQLLRSMQENIEQQRTIAEMVEDLERLYFDNSAADKPAASTTGSAPPEK